MEPTKIDEKKGSSGGGTAPASGTTSATSSGVSSGTSPSSSSGGSTPPASSGKKGKVVLRMVKGAEIPGGHAKCWPFKIGPEALEGLSGPVRIDDTGVEISRSDADVLLSKESKAAVGGRVFEIVEA